MKSRLPDGWKEVTLEDICKEDSGMYGINESAVEYDKTLYRYLRITDIRDDGTIDESKKMSVNINKGEDSKYLLKENDIVFARTGGSAGRSYSYTGEEDPMIFAGFLIKFTLDKSKVLPEYMKYYCMSKEYRGWVQSISTGSTRPNINAEMYKNMKINLPSFKQQNLLVDTLSALDDKIELNNKINANLEKQAQAIFKHWFIDFEFPGADGNPYKSSGDEMVESELGMIPKGWKIFKLGNKLDVELGGTPARKNESYWDGNINWINSGELNSYRIFKETETITEAGLKNSSTKLWSKNTTVIAITGATLGKTSLLLIDTCANQSVVGIKEHNDIPHTFIYPYIINKIPKLTGQQTGGAQQHINKGNVEDLMLLLPNKDVLMKYDNNIKANYQYIEKNEFENIYLSQLRDTLLPKLMSGKIRIP